MAKHVYLSPTAKIRLDTLLEYLKQEWSEKVKWEFIEKLDRSISQISKFPSSCPESKDFKGLYKCVVTGQATLYYRINDDEIEIVTLFDTRQDPKRLDSDVT